MFFEFLIFIIFLSRYFKHIDKNNNNKKKIYPQNIEKQDFW